MNFLVSPLTKFMELINSGISGLIGSGPIAYLIDIFIFTAIIKFILLPLTISQTKSTVKMGELQPKIKELQTKYKNDPQKLQQKQMELYKESGSNPLMGCLPLLIQFPIFIAMYYVVRNFKGFVSVPFFTIHGTGYFHPPYLILLPIVSGLTTYVSGMLMAPKGNDPTSKTQKNMNIYMSIFFAYMSYQFPIALVLYWIISNLIQLAQQYFIINRYRHKEEDIVVK